MQNIMKVCLAQINTTVGDLDGNVQRILGMVERARNAGAEMVVFPELALSGYPPRDLLMQEAFVAKQLAALDNIASHAAGLVVVVGFVSRNKTTHGRPLRNSAAIIADGRVAAVRHKTLLPTYDVFDETRYFEPATHNEAVTVHGRRFGVTICEDAWASYRGAGAPAYVSDPVRSLSEQDVEFIVNVSASPFTIGKAAMRLELFSEHARVCGVPFLYCNQIGGNDELVFDGESQVFASDGTMRACGATFEEDLVTVDLDSLPSAAPRPATAEIDSMRRAIVLGIRDFVRKCGFTKVVLGLSGGVDSSVVAALAAEALGPENVMGVSMPSVYSSDATREDPAILARNLGIHYDIIPINSAHEVFLKAMGERLDESHAADITRQNLQARIRGMILMALSNRFQWMVLATGNKSELATGYCTLYGDMCGALAPIGDVMKMQVYELAALYNGRSEIIPQRVITRPPSAELKPNQTDQDRLPPYPLLDQILELVVEQERGVEDVVAMGFEREVVMDVARMIAGSEHKRRQAAPCLKVTSRAFGHGRRLPIARRMP
jgi:NAD+ synthase (glutamine-hydrolysing)